MRRKVFALVGLTTLVSLLQVIPAAQAGTGVGFHLTRSLPGSKDGNEPSIGVGKASQRYVSWQSPGEFANSRTGIRWVNRGMPDPNALGDVTNAVDADGAIYNGQICGTPALLHTCIYRSLDQGRHWGVTTVGADHHPGASDRPWIDVFPHVHRAHWNPNHTKVYLEYHTFSPDDFVYVTVSTDGGRTFSAPRNITNDPDALSSSSCNTIPSGVVVDQYSPNLKGRVYALWLSGNDVTSNTATGCNYSQLGPFNKAWVSESHDGGTTWTSHLAWKGKFDPSTKIGDNADKIFGTISVDRFGQVHVLLAVRHHDDPVGYTSSCQTSSRCKENYAPTDLLLVTSPDGGRHWTKPFKVNRATGSHFFPWIAAGSKGRIDAIYYRSRSLRPNNPKDRWFIQFAQITRAIAVRSGNHALYVRTPAVRRRSPDRRLQHRGGICSFGIFCSVVPHANRNLADNIALALDRGGGANAAWTNDTGKHSHVEFACQKRGQSAYVNRGRLHGCWVKRR